jgi:hypothetical protein
VPVEKGRGDGVLEKGYPIEFLREIDIVDTPGTNAIIRHHEELSRGFVPRSDLVLFVTSAERALTGSESGYLELIRDWGKKILLVINSKGHLALQYRASVVDSDAGSFRGGEEALEQALSHVEDHSRSNQESFTGAPDMSHEPRPEEREGPSK